MILAAHSYHFIILALLIVFSAFLFFHKNEIVFPASFSRTPHSSARPDISDTFANLFRTIRLSPTHPGYRDAHGKYTPGAPADEIIWTRPLGKRLLVVDIDTRRPTGDNQVFNTDSKINWETLEYQGAGLVTGGISWHYLYAMIHGYDYMHYQALDMEDLHQTWIKPHVFRELLPDYEFVVFFDADAMVSHLEIPLEWMFNRWKITENTMIAMPNDTEEIRDGKSISVDSTGLRVLNSGFVVLQNRNLTFDMLDAWASCTTEERYEGCAQWKHEWSHEQRAFSEYIRRDPEFNVSSDSIVGIPCDDAMGWPNFKQHMAQKDGNDVSDCNGNFIRHYTLGKNKVKEEGSNIVMQSLMEIIQKNVIKHQAATYKKEFDPSIVLESDKDNDYDDIEKLNTGEIANKGKDEKKKLGEVVGNDSPKYSSGKASHNPEDAMKDTNAEEHEHSGSDEEDDKATQITKLTDITVVAQKQQGEDSERKEKDQKSEDEGIKIDEADSELAQEEAVAKEQEEDVEKKAEEQVKEETDNKEAESSQDGDAGKHEGVESKQDDDESEQDDHNSDQEEEQSEDTADAEEGEVDSEKKEEANEGRPNEEDADIDRIKKDAAGERDRV
ncbi:hypothetical protein NX059_004311 [Plenodomus lindquistii]|nr:hypothetical protein NX059_004311 [Plenodomus lindquistii]